MLVHLLNLNHLVTFPASQKHWTFFPIMDVDWLGIKRRVKAIAKLTNLLIGILRFRFFRLLFFKLLLLWLLSFCTVRVNVCLYLDFLFLLFWHSSWLNVVLYKCTFNLFNLSGSQLAELSAHFVAHDLVQFHYAFRCHYSYILESMLDA